MKKIIFLIYLFIFAESTFASNPYCSGLFHPGQEVVAYGDIGQTIREYESKGRYIVEDDGRTYLFFSFQAYNYYKSSNNQYFMKIRGSLRLVDSPWLEFQGTSYQGITQSSSHQVSSNNSTFNATGGKGDLRPISTLQISYSPYEVRDVLVPHPGPTGISNEYHVTCKLRFPLANSYHEILVSVPKANDSAELLLAGTINTIKKIAH